MYVFLVWKQTIILFKTILPSTGHENKIAQPKADECLSSTSHFSPLNCSGLFPSLIKGMTMQICMLCFVLINSTLLNLHLDPFHYYVQNHLIPLKYYAQKHSITHLQKFCWEQTLDSDSASELLEFNNVLQIWIMLIPIPYCLQSGSVSETDVDLLMC